MSSHKTTSIKCWKKKLSTTFNSISNPISGYEALASNRFWTIQLRKICLKKRLKSVKSSKFINEFQNYFSRSIWIFSIQSVSYNIFRFFYFRASVSAMGDSMDAGSLPQYHVDKSFADRRYKVQSARTYFYLNEATCERNMETFIKVRGCGGSFKGTLNTNWSFFQCLEAVSNATFGTGITAIKLTALGRPQLLVG